MKNVAVVLTCAAIGLACSPAPPPAATTPPPPAPPTATPPEPAAAATPAPSHAAPSPPKAVPAGRPKSVDDLVTRAVAAIKAGDGDADVRLMFTLDEVKQNCPKALEQVNADWITRMHGSIRKSVKECGVHHWGKAKQLERTGGDRKRPARECNAEVWELHDIKIVFEIDGKKVHLKLDDPMVFPDGTYAFADDPRCGDGDGAIVPPPPPAPLPPGPELPETPQ